MIIMAITVKSMKLQAVVVMADLVVVLEALEMPSKDLVVLEDLMDLAKATLITENNNLTMMLQVDLEENFL